MHAFGYKGCCAGLQGQGQGVGSGCRFGVQFLGCRFGVQKWGACLGVSGAAVQNWGAGLRGQGWVAGLGCKDGVQAGVTGEGDRVGVQKWGTGLGCKGGSQGWGAVMRSRVRVQGRGAIGHRGGGPSCSDTPLPSHLQTSASPATASFGLVLSQYCPAECNHEHFGGTSVALVSLACHLCILWTGVFVILTI